LTNNIALPEKGGFFVSNKLFRKESMSETLLPAGFIENLANKYVKDLESDQLEYLMNEMYYWRDQAEHCGCAQCTKKGDISHRAYWEEYQRVRQSPDMDHEEERLFLYALSKIISSGEENNDEKKDE